MPNVALIPEKANRVPILGDYVDGFPQAQHRLEGTAGGAPLENGARVTDHFIAQGQRLSLTMWISGLEGSTGEDVETAWAEVKRIHQAGEPITVITPLGMVNNVLILNVTADEAGQGYKARMELYEILLVGLETSDITPEMVADGPAEGEASEVVRGRVIPIPITTQL